MDIFPTSVETARWDIDLDVDLSTATADVELSGAWHALTWTGAATQVGDMWTRSATLLVRGASGGSGQLITETDYDPDVRVTVGSEVIVRPSTLRFRVKT